MFENSAEIFQKIEQGDIAYVKRYVQSTKNNHVDLKTIRDTGLEKFPLLTAAAISGQLEIMVYLIEQGIEPEEHYNNALRWAASRGKTDIVTKLLTYPAVAQIADDGDNLALKGASVNGSLSTVKVLLQNPAIIASLEKNGEEVISRAVSDKCIDVLKEFLTNPLFNAHLENGLYRAFLMAATLGQAKVVTLLLEQPAVRDKVADNENAALRSAWKQNRKRNHEVIIKLLQFRSVRKFEIEHLSDTDLTVLANSIEKQKKSNFNLLSNLVFSSIFGTAASSLILRTIGLMGSWFSAGVLSIGAFCIQTLRFELKRKAYQEYDNKSLKELQALTVKQKQAFEQGVQSSESYWELFKSNIPILTPAANLHWKAYYAGQVASELQDDVLIKAVTRQLSSR